MWNMLIGGAAMLGAGLLGNSAANKQRKAAEEAARVKAMMMQQGMDKLGGYYDEAKGMFQPLIQTGDDARGMLRGYLGLDGADRQKQMMDSFQYDPGFAHMRNQGIRGIEGSRAASGMLKSGGTLAAINDHSMGLANTFFNTRLANLGALERGGAGAIDSMGKLGAFYGGKIADMTAGIGGAHAEGILGAGNADASKNMMWAGLLGNLGGNLIGGKGMGGGFGSMGGGGGGGYLEQAKLYGGPI